MSDLTIGLLGAGRIGKVHAAAIAGTADARLVAVADVVDDAARSIADEYGARVDTIDAIVDDESVDAVFIATPTDMHADLIVRSARAGKFIFCEKPIDLDVRRVRDCLTAVDEADALLMVGFNRRFDPNFREVRRRIEAGEIGDVETVTIVSRDPGPPPLS